VYKFVVFLVIVNQKGKGKLMINSLLRFRAGFAVINCISSFVAHTVPPVCVCLCLALCRPANSDCPFHSPHLRAYVTASCTYYEPRRRRLLATPGTARQISARGGQIVVDGLAPVSGRCADETARAQETCRVVVVVLRARACKDVGVGIGIGMLTRRQVVPFAGRRIPRP